MKVDATRATPRIRRGLALSPLLLALLLALLPAAAGAQAAERCFAETGSCISGRIREFWEANGGLAVFGLPLGAQEAVQIEGKTYQAQQFERTRLELHPENARPYDVLLGRIGADRLAQDGRDWFSFAKSEPQAGCRFFAETGHNVCGDILKAWRASGLEFDGKRGVSEAESLALFGLPLSGQMQESIEGKLYDVQWFERGRFELHPENQPPYTVLLGLLGNEIRANTAAPAPTPAPNPCADVPEPKNARIRPGKCVKQGEVIAMDIYGFQPNEQIGFWLTAPNGAVLGTVHTYNVGPNGAVEGLPFDTKDLDPGLWFWVFKSSTSDYASVIYFKVLKP